MWLISLEVKIFVFVTAARTSSTNPRVRRHQSQRVLPVNQTKVSVAYDGAGDLLPVGFGDYDNFHHQEGSERLYQAAEREGDFDDNGMYISEDKPESTDASDNADEQSNQIQDTNAATQFEGVPEVSAKDSGPLTKNEVQETETKETDAQKSAQNLLNEAESGTPVMPNKNPGTTKEVPLSYYPGTHRSAWIVHGAVGATVFGLVSPLAISSALFRDLVPAHWIYIHVCANVTTFVLTFVTVGMAFFTLHDMGGAEGGHLTELHHVAGLVLLLLASFQTANGFLRPPREFCTEEAQECDASARALWFAVHRSCGLCVCALGTYQVRSGLRLFAGRYGTPDWGPVYLGYAGWLAAVVLVGKLWTKWQERITRLEDMEIQMGRGGGGGGKVYDPKNDKVVAQFETV